MTYAPAVVSETSHANGAADSQIFRSTKIAHRPEHDLDGIRSRNPTIILVALLVLVKRTRNDRILTDRFTLEELNRCDTFDPYHCNRTVR